MHIPHEINQLYTEPGPFATVYLDASRSKEQGGREVDLRWREMRAQLSEAGADEPTLAAMDDAAVANREVRGEHGLVLVAASGRLLFDDVLPRPPMRPHATWAPLPHLMAYFAQRGHRVAHVTVVADRTGADIHSVAGRGDFEATRGEHTTVEGSQQYPITKRSVRAWGERHFQLRVENSWTENAHDVADAVRKHVADISAELIILAGDSRARSLIARDLASALPQHVEVFQLEEGGRAAGSSEEALDEAVHDVLLRVSWRQRRELLAHLQQNLGRHEYAVAGVNEVLAAVRRSQADTVVISDDPSSTLTAWIGPQPLEVAMTAGELRDIGVAEPRLDRFDAALVRAVAGSGAQLAVTPDAHNYLPDGIAALLRYNDPATPVS
jgi:hypothetical protein